MIVMLFWFVRLAAKTVQKLSNNFVVDRSIEGMAKGRIFFSCYFKSYVFENIPFSNKYVQFFICK